MDQLSVELLGNIVERLEHRALLRFSLVNRRFRSVCLPRIFRTLQLPFSSPESLIAALAEADTFLTTVAHPKYVQHLEIVAADMIPFFDDIDFWKDPGTRGIMKPWRHNLVEQRDAQLLTDDLQWEPLTEFIRRIPALKEVTWACLEQIPQCILRHLHTIIPRCRLHMRRFNLQSLRSGNAQQIEISPEDREIATSPCLHSIYRTHAFSGYNDLHDDAILEMLSGGAQNLKEISLSYRLDGNDIGSAAARHLPRQKLRPGSIRSAPITGFLDSLVLSTHYDRTMLRSISHVVDFAVLRTLQLHLSLDKDDLDWLTSRCQFSGLEKLTFVADQDLQSVGVRFILSLPPLRSLQIYAHYDAASMFMILKHCGYRLRQLHCSDMFLDTDLAGKLLLSCPQIEELEFKMRRHEGSAREVTLYHCLGTLPALRDIELYYGSLPDLTCDLEPDRKEEICHALKNLSMDKNLAQSIFYAISSSKAESSWPIESLVLRMDTARDAEAYASGSDLISILWYVGNAWICTRNIDGEGDGVHRCDVEEYDLGDKLHREDYEEDGGMLDTIMQGSYAPAIHHVWPQSQDGVFKDVWHSFPLSKKEASLDDSDRIP